MARRHLHGLSLIHIFIDETDALLAGFRGNHHDDTDVILVGYGFYHLQIIIKGKVWDDGAAHSACLLYTSFLDDRQRASVSSDDVLNLPHI